MNFSLSKTTLEVSSSEPFYGVSRSYSKRITVLFNLKQIGCYATKHMVHDPANKADRMFYLARNVLIDNGERFVLFQEGISFENSRQLFLNFHDV